MDRLRTRQTTFRRLQEIGGGSLFLSIPKNWAVSKGLKKGSLVSMEEAQDGSLILRGEVTMPGGMLTATRVSVVGLDEKSVRRKIVDAYVSGADVVTVAVSRKERKERLMVRRVAKEFLGLELADEDGDSMTYRFMLDPRAMLPEGIVRRMHSITMSFYDELTKTKGAVREVPDNEWLERWNEGERLFLLGARLLRQCAVDPTLSAELGVPAGGSPEYYVVLHALRRIGRRCAEMTGRGKTTETDSDVAFIARRGAALAQIQEKAIRAFLGGANEDSARLPELAESLLAGPSEQPGEFKYAECFLREIKQNLIEVWEVSRTAGSPRNSMT